MHIPHKALAEFCDKSYHNHTFVRNEVEVLVQKFDSFQIVCFRGTEAWSLWKESGWIDVLRDLRFWPTGYYGLRGHCGFLKGARVVEEDIVRELDRNKPVVVSGHSLGGGMAIPCARMLMFRGFLVSEIVTFGTPLCISKGFEYFVDIKSTCYEYGNDIVPTFQFWTPRKHLDRTQIGPKRSDSWFSDRTWDDHDIKFYESAL